MAPHSGVPDSRGGTTLSSQLVLSHLTISATLEGIYRDHFHFTNEETGREAAQQVHLTSKWQSSDSRHEPLPLGPPPYTPAPCLALIVWPRTYHSQIKPVAQLGP